MGRELEDLHLGIVRGEQHLAAAVAVEVGDERRREAVHVVLDREPVVRQVVPRLPEREVALVLPEEEGDGSARVPDRIGEGGGGLTWSKKKTVKAARRRMPRSRFRILAAARSSGDRPPKGSRRGRGRRKQSVPAAATAGVRGREEESERGGK